MMQVAKRIPFEDPNVLNMCRAAYVLSNVIILGITLYIKSVVDKKKGTGSAPFNPSSQVYPTSAYANMALLQT
jgi:hypothetical protein